MKYKIQQTIKVIIQLLQRSDIKAIYYVWGHSSNAISSKSTVTGGTIGTLELIKTRRIN